MTHVLLAPIRKAISVLSNNFAGVFVFVKIGGKMAAPMLKFLKAAKAGKAALAASSFAAYAFILTPEFAAIILGALFVHEYGHLRAMKWYGMETKGMYFIPLLGAAAVSEEAFPTYTAEYVVAIAGPLFGLATVAVPAGIYYVLQEPFWAAVAGWVALVNVFNLLPVKPLDGGRMVTGILFSIDWRFAGVVSVIGLAGSLIASIVYGIPVLIVVVLLGSFEVVLEIATRRNRSVTLLVDPKDIPSDIRETIMPNRLETPFSPHDFGDTIVIEIQDTGGMPSKVRQFAIENARSMRDRMALKPPMTRAEMKTAAAGYVVLAGILLASMFAMRSVPGADAALQVLIG